MFGYFSRFMAGYIERVTGFQDDYPLRNNCTDKPTLLRDFLKHYNSFGLSPDLIADILNRISILKLIYIEKFQKQ